MQKILGILVIFLTALVSGCSFQDETEEQIKIAPAKNTAPDFIYYAKECTKGKTEYAPILISAYVKSILTTIPNNKFPLFPDVPKVDAKDTDKLKTLHDAIKGDFYYQHRKFNAPYETCLQKSVHSGHPEYRDFFVTRGFLSAKISQTFYKEKRYSEGADWARRVINLHGKKMGYYFLGLFFINSDETQDMGADFLKESALLGYEGAIQYIDNYLINFDVFQKVRNKEQGKIDAMNMFNQNGTKTENQDVSFDDEPKELDVDSDDNDDSDDTDNTTVPNEQANNSTN